MWGEDDLNIVGTFGGDIIELGEQLLALRKRLCQRCMMQEVKIILGFDNSPEGAKESQVDVPSD